jgi:hypothetical protein
MIRRLAGGSGAVVACRTCTRCHTSMTEGRRLPCGGLMTRIAALRGCNVVWRFASCRCAVVAACTGARCDTSVTEGRRLPCRGLMA